MTEIIMNNKPDDIKIEPVPFHKLGDIATVKRALKVLKDHYPGYYWRVGINDDRTGGVLYIMNMDINAALWGGQPYGYVLKLKTVYQDPDLKCAMRAGGEILERARLFRGRNQGDEPNHVDGVDPMNQPVKIEIEFPVTNEDFK